ncbi:DUF3293 domain-containing protein [Shewanella corallii]|uniref:DUF3293 domain-containing protein n=2 Tax=Shewanella TaxID=22 RepID=A0ABT0N291_9GAMM|nr:MULTISPECIES: DUF3293 domain-containing protein [Shewanella]MCL1035923.1 DUF3293 domain-containing protein [Shewanella submarina]MCL2912543.1 DUF3293 domain-containing protein [Shewanella corallii]
MTQLSSTLWQYYQQSIFLLTQPFSPHSSFAIVTAFNPMGENLSSCQNLLYDRRLQAEIDTMKVPYRSVIGASPDLQHMEKSWALFCDIQSGLELGREFNQLAIYYVDNGRLLLLPCLCSEDSIELGDFSAKAQLVSELPELEF